MKILKIYALIASLLFVSHGFTSPSSDSKTQRASGFKALKPLSEHSRTNRNIVKLLQKDHYRNLSLDNNFSEKLLDRYLEYLDSSRSYFLHNDIEQFKKYTHKLDEAIIEGNLKPAFSIFNRLQERRIERINYQLEVLGEGLDKIDFSKEDFLETNREDAPWITSKQQAKLLWYRQLKNDVLNLKMANQTLEEIADVLNKRYVNQLDRILEINNEDVFQIYIDAFTQIYDPHTRYLPPRDSENFDISMSLSLEGIGALLQKDSEYTKVVRLVTAGPAQKGKELKPADRIVGVAQGVDGEMINVIGWRLDEVVDLIRGEKGSIVRLNVIPASAGDSMETKEIQITRATVKLEDQAAKKKVFETTKNGKPYKVGVIDLPTFYIDFKAAQMGDPNFRSSSRDVANLIYELKKEKIDALVVDLRNNGGGSLQEAKILTGLFIRTGPVVQVRENNNSIQTLSDLNPGIAYHGPLAVLVNRLSASASEIFAAVIQDSGRGIVVGTQTFGKGTVQVINEIQPGELKYTQAKFYRISGGSTQHKGIIPDIEYPEIYDKTEIGESAQQDALPWDQIQPTRYLSYPLITPILSELQQRYEQRTKNNPDFQYLNKRIALFEEKRNRKSISLVEEKRQSEKKNLEQALLDIENERRKAKNQPLLKTYKDLETAELEEDDNEIDALLTETGNILYDVQSLMKNRIAKSSVPLAKTNAQQ